MKRILKIFLAVGMLTFGMETSVNAYTVTTDSYDVVRPDISSLSKKPYYIEESDRPEGQGGCGDIGSRPCIGLPSDRPDPLGGGTAPPVPLPGAIWILGSGLAGIATFRKRRKK